MRLTIKKKPPLNAICKDKRLQHVREDISWPDQSDTGLNDWRSAVLTDEKRFNLDGSNGFQYYIHGLRKDELNLFQHHNREGGDMVCSAITFYDNMNNVRAINLQYLSQYNRFLKYVKELNINDDNQNAILRSIIVWITKNQRLTTKMAHKVELVIKLQYKKLLLNRKTQPEWVHDLFRDQIEQITLESSDDEEDSRQVDQISLQRSNEEEDDANNEKRIFQMDTQSEEDKEDAFNEDKVVQVEDKEEVVNKIVQIDVQRNEKKENADDDDKQKDGNKKDADNEKQKEIEVFDVEDSEGDVHVNTTELQSLERHNENPIVATLAQTCSEFVTEIDQTSNTYFKLEISETSTNLDVEIAQLLNNSDEEDTINETDAQCQDITEYTDDDDIQKEESKIDEDNEKKIIQTDLESNAEEEDEDNDDQREILNVEDLDGDVHGNTTELQSFERHNENPRINHLYQSWTETDQTSTEIGTESAQGLDNSDKLNVELVQSEVQYTPKRKKYKSMSKTIRPHDVRICNIDPNMNEKNTDQCVICHSRSVKLTYHYIRMHKTESYVSRLTKDIISAMRKNVFLAYPSRGEKVTSENFQKIEFKMTCPFCDVEIKDLFINYYNHFSSHTGEFAYCCDFCKLKKPYYYEMMEHKNRSRICIKYGISTHYVYRNDQTIIHIFQCKLCHFVQLNSANVSKHIMDHHGSNYNENNIEKFDIAVIHVKDMRTCTTV